MQLFSKSRCGLLCLNTEKGQVEEMWGFERPKS